MSSRRPNHRLVKIHRSYTVEEVAALLGVHKNTVRMWVKGGLALSDDQRPMLILGRQLIAYLQAKRVQNKRTCRPGELYCVRCREPRQPAGSIADYKPVTKTVGNLTALCPVCVSIMNRKISIAKLPLFQAEMDISLPQAPRHIGDSSDPSVNSDLK